MNRLVRLAAPLCIVTMALPATAQDKRPIYPEIMPVSQIKAGMKGYGLTVFQGTKIERFEVDIVGVVKKGSLLVPGHDMVLVRMKGGPMTSRGAYLIRGMSGSPIYVNGKLIGAFSQGEPTSKEPLGGVTPIEDMLEAWDSRLPSKPLTRGLPDNKPRVYALSSPIRLGGRQINRVVANVPRSSRLRSSGSTIVMNPCTTFATFSGASRSAFEKLQKLLEPYNVELLKGAPGLGQKPGFAGAALVPGSAFSMMLVTGDNSLGATGTVTFRKGNRLLGFGHPFLGIGSIEAPICSAWVYDVYPLLSGSYKISSPGPIAGVSTQDRNFSVSGVIGTQPKLIPVTVDVKDITTGRSRIFRSMAVSHPNITTGVVSAAVGSAIAEIRNTPGAAIARVETTVNAEEIGEIKRSNIFFDARAIDGAATGDLDDLLSALNSNPFYPVGLKSAFVKVEIESGRKTAIIERVFLKEGKFEPGQTVEIGMVVKPYKAPSVVRTVKLSIPENAPNGRYMVVIRGGAPAGGLSFGGLTFRSQAPSDPSQAPPVNLKQQIQRIVDREKSNEIVVRLVLPTATINMEGEKLTNLPAPLDNILRTTKSSVIRLERDEIKVVEPTDWIISGAQQVMMSVQRKESQENPSGSGFNPGLPPSIGGSPFDRDFSALTGGVADSDSAFAVTPRVPKLSDMAIPYVQSKGTEDDEKPQAPGLPAGLAGGAGAASGNEPTVVRQPITWKQTTKADFDKGVARGLTVTNTGEVRLTPTLARLVSTPDSFAWCLAHDGSGGLYMGTGSKGNIYQISSAGVVKLFATLPEVNVHKLLVTPNGTVWAATGPNGRVYQLTTNGQPFMALATKEKYVLSMAQDSRGNIYIGTGGGNGSVYKIDPKGVGALFAKTASDHVLSLVVDADDNLFAGTGGTAGSVLSIDKAGKSSVLYGVSEANVSALGLTSKGEIVAATAPRGNVYRINNSGTGKLIFDKSNTGYTALVVGKDDTIYAAGSSLFAISPDDIAATIDNPKDVDILSLATTPQGFVYAGTSNLAEVFSTSPLYAKHSGSLESAVHDAKSKAMWGSLRWLANTPAGSTLTIETRTGNVSRPDDTWSTWAKSTGDEGNFRVASPPARFIQYRVSMGGDVEKANPRLKEIHISYLPANQAPKVTFQAPTGGERWSGKQTLRWEATDPDKDTLSYDLYYSTDDGKSWKPLPAAPTTTTTKEKPTAPGLPTLKDLQSNRARPQTIADIEKMLDENPDLPPAMRAEILKMARENGISQATAVESVAPSVSTRETSRSLDTKTLADGVYRFKVVATDRLSNAIGALGTDVATRPVVICNAAPKITIGSDKVVVNSNKTIAIAGVATQGMVAVVAVQYRIGTGDWIAAASTDGIFDSGSEPFTFTTDTLPVGKSTIEIKAYNAAGGTTVEKVNVEIK